jgi:hypothetical protein
MHSRPLSYDSKIEILMFVVQIGAHLKNPTLFGDHNMCMDLILTREQLLEFRVPVS